ncbi:MAG TPA: Dabb family protein [Cyclobacteriaceae bacterium]|jgi:hypothetical protein|nr:Dabb family protein [Cyclobacteriaceae bacterium]
MTKQNRRTFIASASLLTLASTDAIANPPVTSPLIHHVFFWLKNPNSKEDLAKLIEGINTLKKTETMNDFKIGRPAKTPKRDVIDDSYAVSLYTTFSNLMVHDTYQEHPIHKKFVAEYSHLWSKVQVYDAMDI